ncbi:tyrosine kinase receptor Cad96Ca-like [Osmerus mordax]|uniref:tyrosine kinase receptor Cad96Ca-like n=1 Tax=Osmerus mordax TaxID=8014 RepID=UPI00350F3611
MESVNCGTLRSFLQVNKERLKRESNLQTLLTTVAYHIAHAMLHLSSKRVIHCDLALRNIMVNSFPSEVKLTEFGLARDLTYMRSRRGIRKGVDKNKVPLRWYPPEFFQHKTYSFKGDVWSYGILLWEMETFGTLPYPDMATPDEVIRNVCSGYRNIDPESCRPEICQLMRSCWLDPFSLRPSFKDIVRVLENILEDDHDYVKLESIDQAFFVRGDR